MYHLRHENDKRGPQMNPEPEGLRVHKKEESLKLLNFEIKEALEWLQRAFRGRVNLCKKAYD